MNAIDPHDVLAAIGVGDARAISPVTGGRDTTIWRVRRGEREYALRVFRAEQAAAAAREVAAMRAAGAGGVPVPAVAANGSWNGRPVLLVEWCPGRTLMAEIERRPWRTVALGRALGRQQAAIHRVGAPPELIAAPAWVDRMGLGQPDLRARLASDASALIHLDYHPFNVLTDGRDITAVIDWIDSRAGDPRADLARTYVILRLEPLPDAGPKGLAIELVRRLLAWAWLDGYRAAAGPVGGLRPFMAWAGIHLANNLAARLAKGERGVTAERVVGIRAWADRQLRA